MDSQDVNRGTTTMSTDELKKDEVSRNKIKGDSDKLVDAYNFIAWKAENNDNTQNKEASRITSNFRKLKVGDEIDFVVEESDKFKSDNIEMVPISIKRNGEIIGYVHTIEYMREDRIAGVIEDNKEQLIILRTHIINHGFKSKIEHQGNGRLIGLKNAEGKLNREQRDTTEAFPGSDAIITIADNGTLNTKKLPANSEVINEHKIAENQKNSFGNAIYAMLPFKISNKKTQYIAVPLSAKKINADQSNTIATLVKMFLNQSLGNKDADFKAIAEKIASQTIIGRGVNTDPRTEAGLKNIIKLFTYSYDSKNDNLGVSKGRTKNPIFGININKDATILSFGLAGDLQMYKVQGGKVFVRNSSAKEWTEMKYPDEAIDQIDFEFRNHLSHQLFYHNKTLANKEIEFPNIVQKQGIIDVEFSSKNYSQVLKENTQTNLGSYNVGTDTNPE